MPLIQSKSKKALKENIETEMKERPENPKQAMAISYAIQRKNSKKAHGGSIMPMDEETDSSMSIADSIRKKKSPKKMADGGEVDLDWNAEEQANVADDLNYEALKKENYEEDSALEAAADPEDSAQEDHELDHEENQSMIDALRQKIKTKRGY